MIKDEYNMDDPKTMKKLLGRARLDKEIVENGCLLMLMGLPEIIHPLTWIAELVNEGVDEMGNPITVTTGLKFSTLFGYLCCVLIGVLALLVGYAAAFHKSFASDKSKKWITIAVSIFVQSAYILTVSTCMNVTRVASDGKNFEKPPGSLSELEEPNARLLAAMGVLAIIAYWFGMLGSISVLLGAVTKFQEGKPEERNGNYYKGRLFFYSFVLFLGGFAQLVVGAHLESVYDLNGGPIPNGSFYKVAMLIVTYPSISITVGLVQVCHGASSKRLDSLYFCICWGMYSLILACMNRC
jgi:vacuolar-type H+-ATPase subunit I/STV1